MSVTRENTKRAVTSARNRQELHQSRMVESAERPFRVQLWVRLNWVLAEILAAPQVEQGQLLKDLELLAEELNERRQR